MIQLLVRGRWDSITANIRVFKIVDEGLIHDADPTRGRIVPGEVPVAGRRGQGPAEIFDRLVDDDDLSFPVQVGRAPPGTLSWPKPGPR